MLTFAEPKIEIVKCENGYVVEWRDEKRRDPLVSGWPDVPTSGVKIFATKEGGCHVPQQLLRGEVAAP